MMRKCNRCRYSVYPDDGPEPTPHFSFRLHFCGQRFAHYGGTCPWCGKHVRLTNGYVEAHYPPRELKRLLEPEKYLEIYRQCREGKALPQEMAPVLFAIADLGSPVEG